MTRFIALLALLAVATPAAAFAADTELDAKVREMPMRSLERQLKARSVAADMVRRTAEVMGLAENDVQRLEKAADAPVLLARNAR